jgi:hypothetical protein
MVTLSIIDITMIIHDSNRHNDKPVPGNGEQLKALKLATGSSLTS